MVRWLALAAVVAACQGGGTPDHAAGSGSAPPPSSEEAGPAPIAEDALAAAPADAPRVEPEPEPPDPEKLIAELGAIPAWQAVVDRARLLARRGQHGIVYGRVGPPFLVPAPPPESPVDAGAGKPVDAGLVASPYVWLVDDTEGNGTLGIRVLLGKDRAAEGDRVALGGAWNLDDERRWYWKVDALTPLPPAPASDLKDPPAPVPTHEIATGGLPAGARVVTAAKDHDLVYFQLVGPSPLREGDGWLVAAQLGDKPFARLLLPGERTAYGGQEMRAPDERWTLKRAQTYWVRIGRIRKPLKADEPVGMTARTAPVRLN